jgi:hypothetical protein
MQSTAEVIWQGKEEPLVFLDSLKEAHLFFLEGMKNGLSPFYTESSKTSELYLMHLYLIRSDIIKLIYFMSYTLNLVISS